MAGLNNMQLGNIAESALGTHFTTAQREAIALAIANAVSENNRRLQRQMDELRDELIRRR